MLAFLGLKSGQDKDNSITSATMSNQKNSTLPHNSNVPQQTHYVSKDIPIPDTFLTGPSEMPVTLAHVPFATSEVPEYKGLLAVVLDHVLSPDECQQLLKLAEESVPLGEEDGTSPWRPALVSTGFGMEVAITDYRNSDRLIWDQQTVVDRVWDRCAQVEGLKELLSEPPEDRPKSMGRWVFERVNERMRFLKYTSGQFFKAHCDGPYYYAEDGTEVLSHYTVQLYLNDSAKASATGDGHVGGATSFLSRDKKRRVDVNPKAGSVLIFQHRRLFHEGAKVLSGVKYTMRSDILYRWETN